MKLLFLTLGSPHAPARGAQVRDHELMRRVASRHRTALLALMESPEERAQLDAHAPGVFALAEGITLPSPLARIGLGARRKLPLAAWLQLSPAMFDRVAEVVDEFDPDVVQIEHSFLAPYLGAVSPRPGRRTVLSLHNVGGPQYRSMAAAAGGPLARLGYSQKARALERLERAWVPRFDLAIVVSPAERDRLLSAVPGAPVAVVPNGVDTGLCRPLPESAGTQTVLFVGNLAYGPNADAVRGFVQGAWPHIRSRRPGSELAIVGPDPPRAVRELGSTPGITVTGSVPDLAPWYQRATLAIAPLRAGGGTRLKILEAMAFGRAVVSTTLGCEGLGVRSGAEILVADHPEAFAESVLRLLTDDELRAGISARARELVQSRFDWSRIAEGLLETYDELVSDAGPTGRRAG